MIVGGATLDLVGCTSVPLLHLYMYVRLRHARRTERWHGRDCP